MKLILFYFTLKCIKLFSLESLRAVSDTFSAAFSTLINIDRRSETRKQNIVFNKPFSHCKRVEKSFIRSLRHRLVCVRYRERLKLWFNASNPRHFVHIWERLLLICLLTRKIVVRLQMGQMPMLRTFH